MIDRLAQHPAIRHQLHEAEAPAQRGVQQRDGAVGGVHGADEIHVVRHAERLAGEGQQDRPAALVALQHGEQLAEDARDVPAVDLVHDQEEAAVGFFRGVVAQALEDAVPALERQLAVCLEWPVALQEIFVAIGRVEGAQAHQPGLVCAVAEHHPLLFGR